MVGYFAVALTLGLADEARAAAEVDLALVLAVDASYSVDHTEFRQQVSGLAAAFAAPSVLAAIEALPTGAIAVSVTHWSKADAQVVSVPWTIIDGAAASLRFAARLARSQRRTADGATSISGALRHAFGQFGKCGCVASRRVVDVSGDGRNNNGPGLPAARAQAEAFGVTVNGLAILNEIATLHHYFAQQLIVGPTAFVEVAADYQGYARAILKKLLRELNPRVVHAPVELMPPSALAGVPAQGL